MAMKVDRKAIEKAAKELSNWGRWGADDAINMPCQSSTQWDALCHIFHGDKMYNGYDATLVDARGAKKLGIEHVRDKMVGRGVLLDVARNKGLDSLADGYAI